MSRRTVLAGLACSGCVAAVIRPRMARFGSADGVPLSAQVYGEGSHAVLLVPGGHGVGETWHVQAERLAARGLRVVALDYRGRGVAPQVPADDEKAHLDVIGAARQLRAAGASRVSAVGASWGGWAVGTAAVAELGPIDGLVLLAHSPFERPERLGGRKLFIVAAEDRSGTGRLRLDGIRDQYERAPDPKRLVVLDGASHAQFLFLTPQAERLQAEIEGFLTAPF